MKERKQKDSALKQNPVKAPKPAKAQKVPKAPKVPKEKKEKKSGLHSMRFNVVQLVLLSIIISVASLLIMIIPVADNAISTLAESYMRDVCDTCGLNVDAALNRSGNVILNQAYLETLIGDVRINDLDSSYAYVVGSDGTMIYHPDESKVGQPVENPAIKQVVADLEAGKEQQDGMAIYEFRGAEKYAAYYVTSNKAAILVITADRGDILSAKDAIYARAGGAAIIIFIVLGIISFLIASKMTRPIVEITNVIKRFSSLNFAESPTTIRISKRKDETGQMARAIGDLREKLVTIVSQIKSQSELLYNASTELDTNASHTTSTVGNVETAVNEIATGATNQASETQKATDDIVNMGNMIEHTNSQVENLTSTANLMRESSEEAAATLKELDNINQQAIASIDVIYEQTNITNISALKIKEATTLISSIAEETNLLSLNASIEAARAGDSGKGFAVVAEQIRTLSTETKTSSAQIQDALTRLDEISGKMTTSIEKTLELIQVTLEKVTLTGENVQKITEDSTQLGEHIQVIDSAMKEVENSNLQLVDNMEQVSNTVNVITGCIDHSSDISKRILSKYTESSTNIDNIEDVIQALMCELGIGGFMGIADVGPGMKVLVRTSDNAAYSGELISHTQDRVLISLEENPALSTPIDCNLQITVGNIIYFWEKALLDTSDTNYSVLLQSRSKILNRRKYPRIDISNTCTVTLKDTGETFTGKFDNLSANGFALIMTSPVFADCHGKEISVSIHNFALPSHAELNGRIIRCSDNDGMYIIGCQMPEDDYQIKKYVESCLKKGELSFS